MNLDKPRITAKVAGYPLHPALKLLATAYFVVTVGCDLLYSQASVFTREGVPEFADITIWLLGSGLIVAALMAIAAFVDFLGERRFRDLPDSWMFAAGWGLVMALELFNLDIRHTAGGEAIAPHGLILSLAAVAILFATPSRGWSGMYR
jgi:uncharacterized membrane protein